jgi:transcriptional regulator with XRE-family HTH domain
MTEPLSRFARNLAHFRRKAGLSQAELARRADIPFRHHVWQYEQGMHVPRPERLEKIARVLGVPVWRLYK